MADKPSPLLIDVQQLADLLQIGVSTVYAWRDSGRLIQPIKIGRRTLWRYSEVVEWVETGCLPVKVSRRGGSCS